MTDASQAGSVGVMGRRYSYDAHRDDEGTYYAVTDHATDDVVAIVSDCSPEFMGKLHALLNGGPPA